MLIYAISDIHGNLSALELALTRIDLSGDSRLVLLGDYIGYGPQSGATLRCIFDLQKRYGSEKVVVLRGNHEEAFLEWLDTYGGPGAGEPDEYGLTPWNDWLDRDQDSDFRTFRTLIKGKQWDFFTQVLPTLSGDSRNIGAARMVLSSSGELIAWLRELPYFYETEGQILVHAGIDEEADDCWPWATPKETFVGKFPPSTGAFYMLTFIFPPAAAREIMAFIIAGGHGVQLDDPGGFWDNGIEFITKKGG